MPLWLSSPANQLTTETQRHRESTFGYAIELLKGLQQAVGTQRVHHTIRDDGRWSGGFSVHTPLQCACFRIERVMKVIGAARVKRCACDERIAARLLCFEAPLLSSGASVQRDKIS